MILIHCPIQGIKSKHRILLLLSLQLRANQVSPLFNFVRPILPISDFSFITHSRYPSSTSGLTNHLIHEHSARNSQWPHTSAISLEVPVLNQLQDLPEVTIDHTPRSPMVPRILQCIAAIAIQLRLLHCDQEQPPLTLEQPMATGGEGVTALIPILQCVPKFSEGKVIEPTILVRKLSFDGMRDRP